MDAVDFDMGENVKVFDITVKADDVIDMTKPVTDGIEFLRRAMFETLHCEEVCVTSKPPPKKEPPPVNQKYRTLVTKPTVVKELSFTKEWVTCLIAGFSASRQKAARILANPEKWKKNPIFVPRQQDCAQWFYFCYGSDPANHPSDLQNSGFIDSSPCPSRIPKDGHLPLVSVMLQINSVRVQNLLEYHVSWLKRRSSFDRRTGMWLYALLVFIELPLVDEACSAVRDLARECSRLKSKTNPDDDDTIRQLDTFICLVVKYFQQYDLADL